MYKKIIIVLIFLFGFVFNCYAQTAEEYFKNAELDARQRNFSQSMDDLNKAIAINPYYAKAYAERGALYDVLRNSVQALSDLNNAIKLDPNLADAYDDRGRYI